MNEMSAGTMSRHESVHSCKCTDWQLMVTDSNKDVPNIYLQKKNFSQSFQSLKMIHQAWLTTKVNGHYKQVSRTFLKLNYADD